MTTAVATISSETTYGPTPGQHYFPYKLEWTNLDLLSGGWFILMLPYETTLTASHRTYSEEHINGNGQPYNVTVTVGPFPHESAVAGAISVLPQRVTFRPGDQYTWSVTALDPTTYQPIAYSNLELAVP